MTGALSLALPSPMRLAPKRVRHFDAGGSTGGTALSPLQQFDANWATQYGPNGPGVSFTPGSTSAPSSDQASAPAAEAGDTGGGISGSTIGGILGTGLGLGLGAPMLGTVGSVLGALGQAQATAPNGITSGNLAADIGLGALPFGFGPLASKAVNALFGTNLSPTTPQALAEAQTTGNIAEDNPAAGIGLGTGPQGEGSGTEGGTASMGAGDTAGTAAAAGYGAAMSAGPAAATGDAGSLGGWGSYGGYGGYGDASGAAAGGDYAKGGRAHRKGHGMLLTAAGVPHRAHAGAVQNPAPLAQVARDRRAA